MTAGEFLIKHFEFLLSLSKRQLALLIIALKYNMEHEDFIKFRKIAAGWPIDEI